MNHDELINNGDSAGFVWNAGPVSYVAAKGQSPVLLSTTAPHLTVTDTQKFGEVFPGVILECLDGTSIKVLSQGVTRRMLRADRKASDRDMKIGVLDAIRGVRRSRPATIIRERVYVVDGVEHTDVAAAQAAQMAYLIDLGVDPAIARQTALKIA